MDRLFITRAKIIVLSVLLGFSSFVLAKKDDETKATGAIDAKTFDVLMKAQELTEAEKYGQAIQQLDKLKSSSGNMNSYAKSQMWNFYAFIYANQEKYKLAINAYEKILAEPEAPDGLKLTAKYTLAQLYFQLEDYPSVIKFMEQWLKDIPKPTSTAYIMLTQAHYESKSYDKSLKYLQKAIDVEKADGKRIKENWLRLKAAIYFEKNDLKNTLSTYKQLFSLYPKLTYLKQIAGLYGEIGDNKKRLATYDALYEYGAFKKGTDVLNLAYMYIGQEVPYKAGKIIEKGINQGLIEKSPQNVETLANAWAQANEHKKAIPALKRAAQLSDKGILYARLAGVHFDAGDFAKAVDAAKKADAKGGLKRRDNNYMLIGMALFNLKKFESALQAFRQAKQSKKRFNDARKWEQYTLSELERLRLLEESKFQLAEQTQETLEADENNAEAMGENMLKGQIKKLSQ